MVVVDANQTMGEKTMLGGGQDPSMDKNKVKSTIKQLMDMFSMVKDDRGGWWWRWECWR